MASPTDILLSNDTVIEGVPNGTIIGTFTIVDPDPLGDNTLFLLDDAGGAFKLEGNDLIVANEDLIDYDLNPTLQITVIAGRCTADSFIKNFTINILDDNTLSPIINNVTPFSSTGNTTICVNGRFFTDGGSTTLLINGEEYPYIEESLTDTELKFVINSSSLVGPAIPNCDTQDPYTCGIFSITICNGNTDILDNPLCDDDIFLRFKSDKAPSLQLGNSDCVTKPIVQVNIDRDSSKTGFNSNSINWEPNPNTEYYLVRLKYDFNFDVSIGGETTLDGVTLIDGDLVWLANQGNTTENGIWTVRTGPWDFITDINDNVFVDLGAIAFDPDIGNVTRDIIIDVNIDWDKVGIYTIDYYYLSNECVISKATRRVRIFKENASISPVNTFAITDYKIFNGFDQELIDSIIPTGSDNVCCPGFNIPENGLYIRKDGSVIFMADQCMGDNRLTDLANAISDGDAVPLKQLLQLTSLVPQISIICEAGENIGTNMVVRINTDGKVYLASASDTSQVNTIIGVSITDSLIGDDIIITIKGTINNFSTLVQGREYWLSENGAITLDAPLSGFNQVIGIASSCESFILNPQIPLII